MLKRVTSIMQLHQGFNEHCHISFSRLVTVSILIFVSALSLPGKAADMELLNRADQLRKIGKFSQARALLLQYREAIDQDLATNPNDALSFRNRGLADNCLADFKACKEDLTKALSLSHGGQGLPDLASVFVVRGHANWNLKLVQEAFKDLDRAAQIAPKYGEIYHIRALVEADIGRKNQALADLERGSTLSPENELCLRRTIDRCARMKLVERELKWLNKLVQMFPTYKNILQRSQFFSRHGRWKEAIKDAKRCIALDPTELEPQLIAFDGMILIGDYSSAERQLESALKRFPGEYDLLSRKADILKHHKRYEDGVLICRALLKMRGNDPHVYEQMGVMLRAACRFEEAVEAFNLAANFREPDNYVLEIRAQSLIQSERYKEAAADYTKLYRRTGNRSAMASVGACLIAGGEYAKAVETFDIALDPNKSGAPLRVGQLETLYFNKAMSHLRLNQAQEAEKTATLGVRLCPTNASMLFIRAQAYEKLHQYPKAIADLTEIIRLQSDLGFVYAERAKVYDQTHMTELAKKDRERLSHLSTGIESDVFPQFGKQH